MKKTTKKLLSLLLSAILIVTALFSAVSVFAADEYEGKTVIIYTSNLRGDVDKLPKISAVKQDFLHKGANVVLADTGNFLQGSLYASADKGYTVFTLMEKTGYHIVALGKYDFAFGNAQTGAKPHGTLKQYLTLSELLNGGENDLLKKDPSSIAAVSTNATGANTYFTFTGHMCATAEFDNIHFFGYTDPSVTTHVLESSLENITFSELKSVKEDGKFTVCLSNAGNVDADLCIAPAGNEFEIGAYVIDADKNITKLNINLNDYEDDETVLNEVTPARSKIDGDYPENSLAKSKVVINGLQKDVRGKETGLGNLWCDALLDYANKTALEVDSDNVVAIWNGGNLRDFLYDGNINIADIHKVLPFPNTVAIAYVKGSTLLEALEAAGQYDAAFAHVAGMKYTINTAVEFEGGEEYEDSTYKQPLSNRVTIDEINGKDFDKDAVYAVVTSNMIFNGGDTYLAFKNNKAEGYNSYNSSDKVVAVVWNYIKDALGGTIPEKYGQTEGRINFVNVNPEEPEKPDDPKPQPEPAKISISKAKVSGINNKTYTGKAINQSIKVTLDGKTLTNKDYAVSYKNNKNVGTATLTVTGKGDYTGTINKSFKINPKGTKFTKVSNKKKTFSLKWKKQTVQTTGYQIQYSTNKNFKNNVKTSAVKKTTVKKTIKKISRKKTHYVRIRTYSKIGKKTYYSSWSSAKIIKVK